jgi:hypothetical protein
MIITIVLGAASIILGAVAAVQSPAHISNYTTISIQGEPQANITIKGYIGRDSDNPGPRYLYTDGAHGVQNPNYVTLNGTGTEINYRPVNFSNAEVLKQVDGRNPLAVDTWTGLQARIGEQGVSYMAYQIAIQCLDSADIDVTFTVSTFKPVIDQLIREVVVRSSSGAVLRTMGQSQDTLQDPITVYMGNSIMIEILIKADKPLKEIYEHEQGTGVSVSFNFGLNIAPKNY